LTTRQREIIALRCDEGLTYKECARRLGVREGTVKRHITILFEKSGLISMNQICAAHGRASVLTGDGALRPETV
jgi:DNA-binding NarL/FixJ family response regulator